MFQNVLSCSMVFCGILSDSVSCYGFHKVPWDSMMFCVVPCNSSGFQGFYGVLECSSCFHGDRSGPPALLCSTFVLDSCVTV